MIHQIRLGGCIAAACLAAIFAAAAPATAAAGSCTAPAYPGSGYFTSLKVSHVGCKAGRTVTLAHYRCRTENGPKGRCKRLVRGYRCAERRTSIPTEINSRVTCKKGVRRVIYTYQQNT
jgi:hypothetical protein